MKLHINVKRGNVLIRFLKYVYIKVFKRYGTPHEKAIGFGLGVFLGILPGTGPIASLFLASLLRVNRAAALIGSILTNTWVSLLAFMLSIKVGALVFGISWKESHRQWVSFMREFHFVSLMKMSAIKIILPVFVGYVIVAFCAGIVAYMLIRMLVMLHRFWPRKPNGRKRIVN